MTESAKRVIVNSPYTEPDKYLLYHEQDAEHEAGFRVEHGRRPSGFWIEDKGARRFVELEQVNMIREKVKAWRERDYPDVTGTTRELLTHWHDRTARPDTPFFFCQLEAIETLIFLSESREGRSMIIQGDGGNFRRLCTKLCTGGGKTIVMSMLIAWQVCNAVSYPNMSRYTRNILIVAPNLTVKDRLQVLNPRSASNYYDKFCVVPDGMRTVLNQAVIEIHNWHVLDWETADKRVKAKSVVKIPPKGDEAYCTGIVGSMRNILVINDEAHHAWRVKPDDKKAKTKEEKSDREEATVWMRGLDRIDSVRKIAACYDFSATPFVPGRGRNDSEGLFEWIVSDYSLDDGIESGIVKTPMIPIHDNAPIDTRTGKSKLYHIYADDDVKADLNRPASEGESLPDLVRQAYTLLGHDWRDTFDAWQQAGSPTPPVMISVVNRTETAARIEYAFTHGKIDVPELCTDVLRIDSERLSKESESRAMELREMASTVGQEGKPGGQLRNVISVGMLSEGWDARTVTQIMGLRAFSSQLLCEQIVGRGLRRTSYEAVGDGEMLPAEYVDVFGIPFAYLLLEEHKAGSFTRRPLQEVRALDERKEYAITWPDVERVHYVMRQRLSLDVDDVPELTLNAEDVRISAELSPVLNGKPNLMVINDIDLDKFYASRRMQNIIFSAAGSVYDEMRSESEMLRDSNKLHIIGQIVSLTEQYIQSGRIKITPSLFETDIRRRKILLCLNMDKVIKHMWQGIRSSNYEDVVPIFPQGRRERSTGEMPKWWTSRENVYLTRKSHINLCVTDSAWEDSTAYQLDRNPNVKAWAKNDHLNFCVRYVFGGSAKKYLPDFLVKLTNDKTLVLEVKGIESEQDRAKYEALREWVRAVNGVKVYGEWVCDVSRSPADVEGIIAKYAKIAS